MKGAKMTKRILTLSITCVLVFFVSLTATLAWFAMAEDVSPDITGGAVTGYFESGDGSFEHPFVISEPIHVYNLAWLQYLGLLNVEEDGKITQYYFSLKNDINMEGIILPPIGTVQFPFVGHFYGNGKCISNLTVSNYLDDGSDDTDLGIVTRPLSVVELDGENVSITGFFGVVGALDEQYAAKLANDKDITVVADKVNAVHDLFLDNLTIRTETDRSLVGLFAGYVNGSVTNVGVGYSELHVGDVDPLNENDVFNMSLTISAYSLIGKYDEDNVEWVDKPIGSEGGSEGGGDDGDVETPGGDGAGWGGSINMIELRRRIFYIVGAVGIEKIVKETDGKKITSYKVIDKYGYSGIFGSDQPYSADIGFNTNKLGYALLEGTIMPLSIDKTIFDHPTTATHVSSSNKDVTYEFATLDYYKLDTNKALNVEPVSQKTNTGYIIGGGDKTSTANTNGNSYIDYRVDYIAGSGSSRVGSVGIFKSVTTSLAATNTFPTNNNFHMLTIDPAGNTYVITDPYNASAATWLKTNYSTKLVAYDDSRLNFSKYIIKADDSSPDTGVRTTFVNSYADETYLQGIQFKNVIPEMTVTTPGTTLSNAGATVFGTDVYILGTKHTSYEMFKGAINFSVSKGGIVTAIAGTYSAHGSQATNINNNLTFTLFNIYEIKRNDAGQITEYSLIDTVHEVTVGDNVTYEYNKGVNYTAEGYKLVYNRAAANKMTEVGAAYYFEIPLNGGDYAISGCTSATGTYGSVLMYLDIGANGNVIIEDGNEGGEGGEGEGGEDPVYAHKIHGITFVDGDGIENGTTEGYEVVTFSLDIINVSPHLGIDMTFNRESLAQMYYVVDDKNATPNFNIGIIVTAQDNPKVDEVDSLTRPRAVNSVAQLPTKRKYTLV